MALPAVRPTMSMAWKASRSALVGVLPVKASTGRLSRKASARPVIRLVAPGPEVAVQKPARPLAPAYPAASNAAPCSCPVRT